MSDTPRTDNEDARLTALWDSWPRRQEGWLNHARTLERELNATKAALSGRTVSCSRCNDLAAERATIREALETGLLAWEMWANHWRTSPAYGDGQPVNHPTQQAEIDKIKAAIATIDTFK